MPEPRAVSVVAVLNSSDDVVAMLREALDQQGYRTVTAHVPEIKRGGQDLIAFFQEHDPQAVIYDVGPPYEENWTFLRLVMDTDSAHGRGWIITTTNKRALDEQVGPTPTHELIGKPYDLDTIMKAVADALARAGARG